MTDGMTRLAAALADRYRLERELGQGGMATVYLAQDLKHERKVALKVLRPELAAIIGAERFLAEIKTTANLQHPHILALFDSGTVDGTVFYVMPYVEGESLRDRLTREQQLPVEDALRLAREVADALGYAHQKGIIHRDIKPENILLHGGHALVADFGIALAAAKTGGARMTETGMSLGTPHYMSPEQAMGQRDLTPRTDLYALGVVLYEMLMGEPPFDGPTAQAIVARVMTERPRSLTQERRTVPPHVEAAVFTALEKLPADRFASAEAFVAALGDRGFARPAAAAEGAGRPPGRGARAVLPWAIAALAVAGAAWSWLKPAPSERAIRYSMAFPPDQAMRQGVVGINLAFSPDGQRMVYLGAGEGGQQLFVRERDRLEATPLAGTAGALGPVFSPDGERIAFSAGVDFALRVIPVNGGPPTTLTVPGPNSGGGLAWGPDGTIYFDSPNGLSRIPGEGGTPEVVVPLDSAHGELGHAWPTVLPDGRALLFRSRTGGDPAEFDLVAYDLDRHTRHVLTKGLLARYVAPGYLVFLRADGAVLAAPFDASALKLTGPAVPLFDGVMTKGLGSADLALSGTGTLAYVPGTAGSGGVGFRELVRVDRAGGAMAVDPAFRFNPSISRGLRLSPQGDRVALDITGGDVRVWVKRLPTGPATRLDFPGGNAVRPAWSPDGRWVYYLASERNGTRGIWRQRADGGAPAEPVWQPANGFPALEAALSPDGSWLVYVAGPADLTNLDVYAVRPGRDSVARPLLTGTHQEAQISLSPDGHWLAYASTESGRNEIYVRPFPEVDGGRWQVSADGGELPRWNPRGRELFFVAATGDLMAVPVTTGASFEPGTPQRLFAVPRILGSAATMYDVAPDGRSFLMARIAELVQDAERSRLVVVEHWADEVRARMEARP